MVLNVLKLIAFDTESVINSRKKKKKTSPCPLEQQQIYA